MSRQPESAADGDRWVTHESFYVEVDEIPGRPVTLSQLRGLHGVSADPRQQWGWWRKVPSAPMVWFIRGWRRIISPLYGNVCAFYPSCSAYGLEAVTVHGILRGSALTAWRILRCNPFSGGGVDPVPIGRRYWPEGQVPRIVVLNHPPISSDDSSDQHTG